MKVHFPGLNALRFIGAFSVVFCHIELSKKEFGYSHIYDSFDFFRYTSGHLGVVLFYVLSGFLITYLLLAEKQTFQKISIFDFYVRRALRIWPIYYLLIGFVFFILPQILTDYPGRLPITADNFLSVFAIYFLLVPNLAVIGIGGAGGAFQLGTIGTEEQFYWGWPWLVSSTKHIFWVLCFVFVSISLLPHFVDYSLAHFNFQGPLLYFVTKLKLFLPVFQINCMAMGGLMSYFVFTKQKKILSAFYHPSVQFLCIMLGFGGWLFGMHFKYFTDEVYAVLFATVILNVATNPKNIFKIENPITNYLGKVSYGLYVFHWVIVLLVLALGKKIFTDVAENSLIIHMFVYLLSVGLTLAVSHVSYTYYESYFLKMKDKFAKIHSS